ncbi:rhodanese-like domain-containing protein [Thalassobacillus pellis]|uniref:rhodanese-like domain-containing protein n=1 Tax=Thalassobacillus pellis TaxID=748008 RepID=UPI00195F5459|nr:rhodanese-like domain-containing protein [Thalassobacillus pellis]MBM7554759.1 rhodanese-related sulfurtransferase [Thalassobacillus pellis]
MSIREYKPEEVQQMLNENKDIKLIDVREDEEVAQGMIPSATHIPLGNIPESADNLDKDLEYIMVCRSGQRSMNAARYLNENGFTVHNLEGGMLNWDGETKPKA